MALETVRVQLTDGVPAGPPHVFPTHTLPVPLALKRRSALDHAQIQQEPKSAFQRYFRLTEKTLAQRNLLLSLIEPRDLGTANDANIGTWEQLIPILDVRVHPLEDGEMITFGLFGPKGDLAATVAVRLFEIGTSLKHAFESLHLFYGANAEIMRARESFVLTAPSAATLEGRIVYRGGFWVRPDLRRTSIPRILARLARNAALAAWNPDVITGLGTDVFRRPEIAEIYGVGRIEPAFVYTRGGAPYWEGVLTITERAEAEAKFSADLDELDAAEG